MKRVLILLISLIVAVPLCAQQTEQADSPDLFTMSVAEYRRAKKEKIWQEFPKMEVRLGYGGFPLVDVIEYGYSGFEDFLGPLFHPSGDLEDLYAPADGATYMTGNISAEFSWHIKNWLTLAGTLVFDGIYGTTIDPSTGEILSRDRGVTVSIIPTLRFYWANFEKCRLYSSVGLGVMTTNGYHHIKNVIPTVQLSPFGITAGTKVFFFAEYSMGLTCLGGQIGVGYRF